MRESLLLAHVANGIRGLQRFEFSESSMQLRVLVRPHQNWCHELRGVYIRCGANGGESMPRTPSVHVRWRRLLFLRT